MLGSLRSPIALIEVGASAGLILYPDRYSYSYDETVIGDSSVHIEIECSGPAPIPTEMPEISWRRGIDLNPLDVRRPDDVGWLRACIWPEHHERRVRLDRAVEIVASVFHSAVMSYLPPEHRQVFAANMSSRPDVVWISNEGPGVISGLVAPPPSRPNAFVLGLNGIDTLAHTDPHGGWLAWLESA